MSTRSQLTQQLGVVAGFDNPRVDLEQYRTPPELASYLVHVADLQDDIEDQRVIDLGCGTGMLALAATLRGPRQVVGVDIDGGALRTAQQNRQRIAARSSVSWVQADATQIPLAADGEPTVVMNPPFGAQDGNEHADRAFLETTADLAGVSYSIHNAGSAEFVESFADDNGGEVTHAYSAEFDLPATFEHHTEDSQTIEVELFRIEW
ncbi:METTL5 family protein [Halovenus halobia]|uniref:METTL5 family protein n=1 Tax=Halovenus halobia TaxID=3396622 RepID=UPI003F55979B